MNKLDYDFARFEFFICQNGRSGPFNKILYNLIAAANIGNRHKIAMAFPLEVKIWEEWKTSDSPDKYLEACQHALSEDKVEKLSTLEENQKKSLTISGLTPDRHLHETGHNVKENEDETNNKS